MASYEKTKTGWRVQLMRAGIRHSNTFTTKAAAQLWAAKIEHDADLYRRGATPNKTLGDLLERYSKEVSEHKRGQRWEQIRIEKLKRDAISKVKLADLNASHFADWRDRSLAKVSAASVRREWNVLNPAMNTAVKEWRWLPRNPMADVKRPKPTRSRDRLPTEDEIERLILALGYDPEMPPETAGARVGAAFLFAIETGMRAGEICSLTPERVDLKHRTAQLQKTKNGDARTVPLSTEAVRILKQLMRLKLPTVFDLNEGSRDTLFRKARERAGIVGLNFHDSRRLALTRLATKFTVMELAKISGHKDLRILLSVYYEPSISELAKKLD